MRVIVRRLIIHGRVQGVFYRGWAVEAARPLGLRGWVRNRRDGTVEMLIAGEEGDVRAMAELCRQGPPSARVERVEAEDSREEIPPGFGSRPTL